MIIDGTPWELHEVREIPVCVKREDLCCPHPGPSFSKIRGLDKFLRGLSSGTIVGVLDTIHSKAGWGTSYLCQALGLKCYNFYPVYKSEIMLRDNQIISQSLGAHLIPLPAGRSAILYHQARKQLEMLTDGRGIMLPNGLKLVETVGATAWELLEYTPDELFAGTWVVSISSGTICAGVLRGLCDYSDVTVIAHMGYSRSSDAAMRYMLNAAHCDLNCNLRIIDEGYTYRDAVTHPCPFPCNEYYDLKAWKWLCNNIYILAKPIIFWNIGS